MLVNFNEILRFADCIPGHHLRYVKTQCPDTNSWGVYLSPDSPPDTLHTGVNSDDFAPNCWPFMSAHEAVHSLASPYFPNDNPFQYLLYNIIEDLRINRAIIEFKPDLEKSYEHTRAVIIKRWNAVPLRFSSRTSVLLQHLCFLNYIEQKQPSAQIDWGQMQRLLEVRKTYLNPDYKPILALRPDREAENQRRGQHLIALLQQLHTPRDLNTGEIRRILQGSGWIDPPAIIEEIGANAIE